MADPLVGQVNDKLRQTEQKVQEFFNTVNDVLSWIPDGFAQLTEADQQGLNALAEKIKEFWKGIRLIWEQPGDSTALREKSQRWADAVANPIGDIAGHIALNKLAANVEWTGRAAEAYKAMVPAQAEGLTNLKNLALQARNSLNNLANALDSFRMAMVVALGVFAVGIVSAIATACTVVGTAAAVALLATTVGACLTVITTAVMAMNSYMQTIHTEQTALAQKTHDVGTTWSRSPYDLSDGSVSDGDGTDWRPNQ
ncbi:hypothetical protein GCM10025787_49010 [Saccharopolyspora rosea]|uniref:Proteins of 100 residues with WXG n=1 Tax=Saccharopolyspora rosea TaxID=524884 RepID=A0ABW3FXK9_9PSEU